MPTQSGCRVDLAKNLSFVRVAFAIIVSILEDNWARVVKPKETLVPGEGKFLPGNVDNSGRAIERT